LKYIHFLPSVSGFGFGKTLTGQSVRVQSNRLLAGFLSLNLMLFQRNIKTVHMLTM
jgi:hypothetical protein